MQVWLALVAAIIAVFVLFAVILLVINYGHPDDKNTAWVPRISTVFGLWLAFCTLLILPYDVAASRQGGESDVDVSTLWLIDFIVLFVVVIFLLPFSFFFYESDVDDDEPTEGFGDTQLGQAIKYTVMFLIIIIILFFIMYALINQAVIPVRRIAQSTGLVYQADLPLNQIANNLNQCGIGCFSDNFNWIIPISFPLFIVSFIAFIGWFFFTLFVGVGLFALPLDLINAFRTRPKPISTKTYFEERTKLGDRAKALLDLAKKLQSKQDSTGSGVFERGRERTDLNAFEKHYFYLKKDYQMLYVAHKLKGGNPLVYFGMLIGGLICIIISLMWYIHIAIFILPSQPYHPFLNSFFMDLENIDGFPLFGVLAFAVFSFYLLWCVVKGNFSLGVRFLFWKIFPMELGNTLMNAFLLNTFFILMCSVPCVQFCIIAFPIYARYTQANVMFGNQIKYLTFFRYFYINNVFIIALLVVSSLTIVVLLLFPKNKAATIEAQLDRLGKSTGTSLTDYTDDLKK